MIKFTTRVSEHGIAEHGEVIEALERLNNLLYYTVGGRNESGLWRTYCIFPQSREQFDAIVELLNYAEVYYDIK